MQDVIQRIRWDPDFGAGEFSIGYYDRTANAVVVVPFADMQFAAGDHFAFNVMDNDGVCHHVPLHRIRDIYRNGERIWHRQAPP